MTPGISVNGSQPAKAQHLGCSCLKQMMASQASQAPQMTTTNVNKSVAASIKQLLTPDAQGQVHEEQLQDALIRLLLESGGSELQAAYQQLLAEKLGTGEPPMLLEEAVRSALLELVELGLLDATTAQVIYSTSFQAAQLDNDLGVLYDNRGSANDRTIAVLPLDEAVMRAERMLTGMANGEIKIQTRNLETGSQNLQLTQSLVSTIQTQPQGGFLWKPNSEKDGKLVVLLPTIYSGKIVDLGIYRALPASQATLIERGQFSSDANNGGRAHFRFNNNGANYPDGSYVVATLFDGRMIDFQIGESSRRQGN